MMGYNYEEQRSLLFTEAGQLTFIKVRDRVKHLLEEAGAFRMEKVGGSWDDMACVDRMVEIGELVEYKRECWGQYRVFTTPETHNL
jgi:hypothetical protein